MSLQKRLFALALAALPVPAALADAGSWTQFRGPTMQGVAEVKGLPEALDEKKVEWKAAIHGKAWSSPVIADGQVWMTTATADGKELSVIRVDAKTGKVTLDEVLFKVPNPQFCIPFNSYASPTPVVEGDRVYVTFGSPGTACLDAKSGKKIWERTDFVCNHFRGSGSSLTLWQDRIFMNFDGSDFQYIAAVDKQTGKTLWKTDRTTDFRDLDPKTNKPKADGDFRKGFTTPRVATFKGRTEVVSVGSKCVYSYDPATGAELWRLEFAKGGNPDSHTVGVTPVIGDEFIYICTGNGKAELWALKPGGVGQLDEAAIAWKVKKNVPKRPSPLLLEGLLYTVDDEGMASCIDAKTGADVWKERLPGKGFSASPTFADGKIYFLGENGATTTIVPGKEFKKVGEGTFAEGFMASPAPADGAIFLRTKAALYKVQK